MFALGNSSYPSFCGFGTWLDSALSGLSGRRLLKIGCGDELGDRESVYNKWSEMAYKQACLEANLDLHYEPNPHLQSKKIVTKWVPLIVTQEPVDNSLSDVVCNGILFKNSYMIY